MYTLQMDKLLEMQDNVKFMTKKRNRNLSFVEQITIPIYYFIV